MSRPIYPGYRRGLGAHQTQGYSNEGIELCVSLDISDMSSKIAFIATGPDMYFRLWSVDRDDESRVELTNLLQISMSIQRTVIATEICSRSGVHGEIVAVSGSPLLVFCDADGFLEIGISINDCGTLTPMENSSPKHTKYIKHWKHSKSFV